MRKFLNSIKYSAMRFRYKANAAVSNSRGDFYISDAVISEHSALDTKCTR